MSYQYGTQLKWLVLAGAIIFVFGLAIISYHDLLNVVPDDIVFLANLLMLAGLGAGLVGVVKMARIKQLSEINQNFFD